MSTKAKQVAILGGRGYVGSEIIKIFNNHEHFYLAKVFSSSVAGTLVDIYSKDKSLKYEQLNINIDLSNIDFVILALPNNASEPYINLIDNKYKKITIIDISSDNRFNKNWFYSIPELSKMNSNVSTRISNPGCYASAMQFSILPIKSMIKGKIHSFGISGYSGAGASPNKRNNLKNLENNIIPYNINGHSHEKEVSFHCYQDISFTPNVASFFRGILMTSHFSLKEKVPIDDLIELYEEFYRDFPLVQITKDIPMIKDTINKHITKLGGFSLDASGKTLKVCCTLDNLLKGAATQVIQNLNISLGINNTTGITYE